MFFVVILLLIVFYFVDTYFYKKETNTPPVEENKEAFGIEGGLIECLFWGSWGGLVLRNSFLGTVDIYHVTVDYENVVI